MVADGGLGSGFIINTQGEVITNAHVVGDDAVVEVWLHDERRRSGQVVGLDEYLDLALIKLSSGQGLRPLSLGSSAEVSAGQDILAIGYPLDSITPTVTRGIVSALVLGEDGTEWVQMDVAVNPGSSGGPVLDRDGRVVGVVTLRQDYDSVTGRPVHGVGYALAVSELKGRLKFLSSGGQALIPVPTPTPVPPTPTPLPIKPTGDWATWDDVQSWGFESDKDGHPRIVLQGEARYSWTRTYLQVDCSVSEGRRKLSLYVTEATNETGFFLPNPFTTSDWVGYSLDGAVGESRWWEYDSEEDNRRELWYAPDPVMEAIVEALLKDPRKLVVTLNPSESWARDYLFYPRGFKAAAKPVLDSCGW